MNRLEDIAKNIRREIFDFMTANKVGHLASSLSCVDILVSLYYDSKHSFKYKDDILIFGKAHGSPALYPILVDLGYIQREELAKFCLKDGILRLHADQSIPGCHFVGGSLGNGIGYAAGVAYGNTKNVIVLLGDGELYEGSVWETLMFISHHNLNNMRIIIDRNGMCTIGETEKMIKLEPLKDKMEAFGFDVVSIDGHNFSQLRNALSVRISKPQVIIAKTIKGKGISFMEGQWIYHSIIPQKDDLIKQAKQELK